MLRRIVKPMSIFLICSFLLLDFSVQAAKAGLITTEAVVAAASRQGDQQRVADFLGRAEVKQAMVGQGVAPAEAMQRLDSLADVEVARLAKVLDQLPAGGDGVGAVIGAGLLIFVILLITDILGLTHVFSFVNR